MAATQALVKTLMVEPEEMGATLVDAAPQVEMVGGGGNGGSGSNSSGGQGGDGGNAGNSGLT
nr:hypothetical protein [Yersinia pestis]